jgi:hypothetical protein
MPRRNEYQPRHSIVASAALSVLHDRDRNSGNGTDNPDKSDVRDVAQDISVGLFIETVFAESNCYRLEYLG